MANSTAQEKTVLLDFLQHEVDLCREQNGPWLPYSKVKPSDFITEALEYR